jgi:hypothetical protein
MMETSSTYRVVAAIVALRAATAARVLPDGDVLTAFRFVAAAALAFFAFVCDAGVSGLFPADDGNVVFDAEDVPGRERVVGLAREATRPAADFRAGLPVRVAHIRLRTPFKRNRCR